MTKEEEIPERRSGNNYERHFQSVVVAVAAMVLFALYQSVQDMGRDQAELKTDMGWMKLSMIDLQSQLKEATNGRYTLQDAARDSEVSNNRFKRIEHRIQVIENDRRMIKGNK